jgi:hypothetical protein
MVVTTRYLLAVIVLVGCESTGGGSGAGSGSAKVAESGTKRGSAGGFSATLAQEMGPPEGSLGAAAPPSLSPGPAAPAGAAAAGSSAPSSSSGSSAPSSSSGSSAPSSSSGSSARSAPAAPSAPGAPAAVDPGTKAAGSAVAAAEPAAGSAAATPGGVKPASTPPNQSSPPPTTGKVTGAVAPAPGRGPVKPPPELAAIKFDLEPNWDRDYGEAGTFSLVVKLPSSEEQRVFSVRYGYEDPAAPFDCDQYRKFLEDKKVMTVTLNRQRGAACYIEGTDGSGVASYRFLINYGGKRLLCNGSLYKDAASAALGDLRDKVLMQAKKICETLAL